MDLEDIPAVLEVDRDSYPTAWPASAYRREILHNRNARYIVLREMRSDADHDEPPTEAELRRPRLSFLPWPRREDVPPKPGRIIGYAGMWLMVDEAHITTIAVRTSARGRGYGELLLASLTVAATDMHATRVTLEVRITNEPAQSLYRKYGFAQEGVRPRYYSDNNEDAYIMSTGNIQDDLYRERFEGLVDRLQRRLESEGNVVVESPAFTSPGASAERRDSAHSRTGDIV
jgi:ribosomal-protein-alanine N-acetyltransferase